MKFKRKPMAVAISVVLIAGAAPVLAQEAQKDDKNALDKVIVTATKRSEAAHKVPFNINTISEEQLREQNITDVKKLIQQSEAISAPDNSARFADSVTVRGLNVSGVNANNLEQFSRSTLSFYLDDTPLPNIGYRIKDIARVETLLGPQGTLYGGGALGGTIRYITNKPVLGQKDVKLNTSFYQTRFGGVSNDTDGVVNFPLGDNFAFRASYAKLDEKGYTDRIANPPWRTGAGAWTPVPDAGKNLYANDDWQKVDTVRAAVLWQLTPAVALTLTHAEQDQTAHGTSGASLLPLRAANSSASEFPNAWKSTNATSGLACAVTSACPFPTSTTAINLTTPYVLNDHTVVSRYPEYADRTFKLDSLDLDWDLGFAKLHSSTSWFKDTRKGEADYARQGNAYYNWFPEGSATKGGNSLFMNFDNAYKGFSHETRLVSNGDGPLSWIAGFYATNQERSFKFNEMLPGLDQYLIELPSWGVPLRSDGLTRKELGGMVDSGYFEDLTSDYKEHALFGEATYALTDRLKATVGGRYFNFEDTAGGYIVDYAGSQTDTRGDAPRTTKDTGQSFYKLNLAYSITNDALAYLTYSQGFRRGGTNGFRNVDGTKYQLAQDLTLAKGSADYKPDSTDNLEVGVKGLFLDKKLYAQLALYQIDWKNAQTYRAQNLPAIDPVFGPLFFDFPVNGTMNGPDARSTGMEFNVRYKLNANWQVAYATASTDAEFVTTKTHCLYESGNDLVSEGCRTWTKGEKLNGAPKWKHTFNVRWATYLENGYDLGAGLTARYTGQIGSDRGDSFVYPSRMSYTGNFSVSRDNWSTTLWVENITDERDIVSSQFTTDAVAGPRVIYNRPRTVGLNVSYSFK